MTIGPWVGIDLIRWAQRHPTVVEAFTDLGLDAPSLQALRADPERWRVYEILGNLRVLLNRRNQGERDMGATTGENTLERYRQDAIEATRHKVIRATSLDEPTPDLVVRERADLVEDICALVQRYVAHDLEWAALAIESVMTNERLDDFDVGVALVGVVASIRERGRTP